MNKYKLVINKILLLLFMQLYSFLSAKCQITTANHQLNIVFVDKDSLFNAQALQLQKNFSSQAKCTDYINHITALLIAKGYPTASVDTIWQIQDSSFIQLFLGKQYHWVKLNVNNTIKMAMAESGYNENYFLHKSLNIEELKNVELRILNYYENNGYPFAQVLLDSINLENDNINAVIKVDEGLLYHLDSIRLYGNAKISKNFLQHYLFITNGSSYNVAKLKQVSKRLLNLPYLQEIQPNNITMLGQGSILNLYLMPKKSSQFNFLLGLLPSTNAASKFQLTADINLNLKNSLGRGETIFLNWQQLQPQSPKLNLGYQHPYIFNSNFGFDFSFDLFKKDSSYLQLNALLGIKYVASLNQSTQIFVQWQSNYLLAGGINVDSIKTFKQLPYNVDETAVNVGLSYNWINTDYHLSPRHGNELLLTATTGIKKIQKNNAIISIADPTFNYTNLYDSIKLNTYQFKLKFAAAHYFPIAKQATLKAAINIGLFSSQNIFKNDLFQIGGYKLLRGFNEESIYATQYEVATTEYRYQISLNSYLFGFIDGGFVKSKYQAVNTSNNFLATGIGMFFETKFGLLNISYAIGKRNDVPFNLQEASKIHFGYINYF